MSTDAGRRSGPAETVTAADFLAVKRPAGLFTTLIDEPIGARAGVAAYRRGIRPSVVTIAALVLGVGAGIAVIALAGPMARGAVPHWLVGLGALVVWHAAYALDCADGQLARITRTGSPAGGRLDILCDVAVQTTLCAAVATVAHAYHPGTPVWLLAAFTGTWLVNLVTSVLSTGEGAQSLVTSSNPVVTAVKLIRDYGALITLIGLVLLAVPGWSLFLIWLFTVVNGLFLLASIAAAARTSLRVQGAGPQSADAGSADRPAATTDS